MHIVSVVPNSAVRDSRIVKEARTLAAAGHKVSVVGVMEPDFPSYRTSISPDIPVYRVPYAESGDAMKKKLYRLLVLAGLAVSVLVLGFIAWQLIPAGPGTGGSWWSNRFAEASIARIVAAVLLVVIVAFWLAVGLYVAARIVMRKPVSFIAIPFVADLRHRFFNRINLWARRRAIRIEQSRKIVELAPDVIYCHEAMALPGCVEAKRSLKVPLVYDAHEFYDETEGVHAKATNAYYRKVHTRLLGEVDYFITVSQTIVDMYRRRYPQLTDRISVLPNSIIHRALPPYDGRLHRAAKLPAGKKIVLYQGGISTPRLVQEVVKAARSLPSDWAVVVMGNGAQKAEMTALAEKINDGAILRQASSMLTADQVAELKERTLSYFGGIQSRAGGKDADEYSRLAEAEGASGAKGIELETYVEGRINALFQLYARQANQARDKRREQAHRDQLVERLESVFWEAEQLIEVKAQMRSKYWEFARRLAMRDMIAGLGLEFSPCVSIIDAVPQGELLEWTQGATVGVIPYPITSANHWGCAPNKLWEYTGAGVPLISTPSREISQFIAAYGFGWTISADPKAREIADLVRSLDDAAIAAAKEGCARFIAESNWQSHSKEWVSMIDGIRA